MKVKKSFFMQVTILEVKMKFMQVDDSKQDKMISLVISQFSKINKIVVITCL